MELSVTLSVDVFVDVSVDVDLVVSVAVVGLVGSDDHQVGFLIHSRGMLRV